MYNRIEYLYFAVGFKHSMYKLNQITYQFWTLGLLYITIFLPYGGVCSVRAIKLFVIKLHIFSLHAQTVIIREYTYTLLSFNPNKYSHVPRFRPLTFVWYNVTFFYFVIKVRGLYEILIAGKFITRLEIQNYVEIKSYLRYTYYMYIR